MQRWCYYATHLWTEWSTTLINGEWTLTILKITEVPELISAVTGRVAGCTMNRSPVCHRTARQTGLSYSKLNQVLWETNPNHKYDHNEHSVKLNAAQPEWILGRNKVLSEWILLIFSVWTYCNFHLCQSSVCYQIHWSIYVPFKKNVLIAHSCIEKLKVIFI